MATKLDVNKITGAVTAPFESLAQQIEGNHRTRLANQYMRDVLEPRARAWEEAEPVFFKATTDAAGFEVYLRTKEGDLFDVPKTLRLPKLGRDVVSMKELVEMFATDKVKEEMDKALTLREKSEQLGAMIEPFLEGFTSLEQAIFSLPELKSFAPVKCASQKRPRVFKVPSNDLRRLMMESVRLKEALNANAR